jgi:hypothetical protein
MAKFDGIFEIQGTMKGMTFYKTKDGLLIRAKGGVSKQRIMNDPAFQRTRENGSEFSHNAKMSQLLRRSIASLLPLAKDYRVSSRLSQTMSWVKNLDFESVRGQRKVAVGIASESGKQLLRGFNFNANATFGSVFKSQYILDPVTGVVSIAGFSPSIHLGTPQGATHVSFSIGVCALDFETEEFETTYSERTNFSVGSGIQDFVLTPLTLPLISGTTMFYFLIEFFQEINNEQYPLRNNAYNVLYLMEVV